MWGMIKFTRQMGGKQVDNRPIGVFDSGLGGLTAVRQLMDVLPDEDIIYLGDTGRVPYGGRSKDTIVKYAKQDMAFLTSFDIKAIVIACGTVSTAAFSEIDGKYGVPIIAVVAPAVQKAVESTKSKKIGLIGTVASINSKAYEKMILEKMPDAEIFSAACPLLVPLVENGRINRGDIMIETAIREYLEPIKAKEIDTLILGCTHYPLLNDIITDYMGEKVSLVSPGAETAYYVEKLLKENDLSAEKGRKASCRYYVTDSVEGFSEAASLFLNTNVRGEVSKTDLSIYED